MKTAAFDPKRPYNPYLPVVIFFALFLIAGPAWAEDKDETSAKEVGVTAVRIAAGGLAGVLKNNHAERERIQLIRDFIDPIRFYADKSGYFYVYDYRCVNIAHATQKDLQGKNLYDYKDSHGKWVIRELSEAARNGGGFVEYFWIKPGAKGEKRKLGYVEPIPGTDYFIGTGIYLAD